MFGDTLREFLLLIETPGLLEALDFFAIDDEGGIPGEFILIILF